MLIEYHFVQKLYFQSSLITDYNLGEEPTFLKHRDILNAMLFVSFFLSKNLIDK